jgi:type I restriction enzyme, R subunit
MGSREAGFQSCGDSKPETMARWLATDAPQGAGKVAEGQPGYGRPSTFLICLQSLPALVEEGLWPAQIKAVQNLELSLRANHPRALIQMAKGELLVLGVW